MGLTNKLLIGFLFVFGALLVSFGVFSGTAHAEETSAACRSGEFFGFPAWYEYLDVTADEHGGCNVSTIRYPDGSLNAAATIGAVLLAIVEMLLRIAGVVAVGFVVYGGVSYTTSQGMPEKTAASKNIILNGLIGLVIASLAVVIVNLVGSIIR